MEYIVIKRTKLYKSNDMISIEKTAKTLDDAVKFKVALEMLDSGESKSPKTFSGRGLKIGP
jgi:hypothetical protein